MFGINRKVKAIKQALEKNDSGKEHLDTYAKNRVKVFLNSTGLTLLLVLSFAGIGFMFDMITPGSGHKFLIISLVLGYPFTQMTMFIRFRRFAQKQIHNSENNG